MSKTGTRSVFHSLLRGFLVLIALAAAGGFVYFARRHGIVLIPKTHWRVSAEIAALATPGVGILAIWLAVLVEYHQRTRSFGGAVRRTLRRLWWMPATVLLAGVWVWVVNRV